MTTSAIPSRNGQHHANATAGDILPQNLDAERCVLGAIFFDPRVLDEVRAILHPDHFYLEAHRWIFEALIKLADSQSPIDAVIVGESLEKAGRLDDVGAYAYLQEITEAVPYAAHGTAYALQVRDKHFRREVRYAAAELAQAVSDPTADLDAAVSAAEARLHAVQERDVSGQAENAGTIALRFLERMRSPRPTGIRTGFDQLDDLLGGLKPGQLIVVAARPGVGKTAFAAGSLGMNVAGLRIPVMIFSLEQSQDELFDRLITGETRLAADLLQSGKASGPDILAAETAANRIAELPLIIDAITPRTVSQIAAQTRLHRRRDGIELVVVDYLQLITAEDRRANRETQVAGISRELKLLARNQEIPVVALAQLNRGVELREDKRPRLADLRESGAIEQDADVVIFLHRPALYDRSADPEAAMATIAKHRNGQTGEISLRWEGDRMRFTNERQSNPFGY